LETASTLLGPLLDEVVFVGGASVRLWINEPGTPPTRATEDVDVGFMYRNMKRVHAGHVDRL
jgi:hypothetical protein